MSSKITFNFDKMEWENITVLQVKFWESCYPDIDVVEILTKRMPAWLDANPEKAKKTRWKKFINSWLSREQERRTQWKSS